MRVAIVSAYPTVRAGLRALMLEHADWSVVSEASPAALRAEEAGAGSGTELDAVPDVLIADVDAAGAGDQLNTLIQIIQPRAGVVAIGGAGTDPGTPVFAPGVLLGASSMLGLGVLPRDATAEEIVAAVEAAAHGLIVLDRGTARRMLATPPTPAAAAASASETPTLPGETLTARELEVLQLLAEGLPNKLIAARLHVSEHTAKFHVASIMTKLGAASRTEAVTLAARRGLLIL